MTQSFKSLNPKLYPLILCFFDDHCVPCCAKVSCWILFVLISVNDDLATHQSFSNSSFLPLLFSFSPLSLFSSTVWVRPNCVTSTNDSEQWQLPSSCVCVCVQIKGSDAGWTLGYMLNLTNMIPAEAPDSPPLPHAGYVSIVTIMAVLLFILFIVSLRPLWPRCSKQPQIV